MLSINNNISDSFFERHLDRVDWRWLSQNINVSEEFFERHLDNVIWEVLPVNNFNKVIERRFKEIAQV